MTRSNRYIHSRAARLNVERLETRDCPACVVYQTGGVVHVVGDESANTIVITELGASPPLIAGGLTITADGVSRDFPAGSVRRIGVQTRGGDDIVTFKSSAAAGNDSISWLALNLGRGNDSADVAVSRNVSAPADFVGTWNLTVNASAGDDTVVTRFGSIDLHSVRIQANLGDGDDMFAALFTGPIAAANQPTEIRLNVQGGAGDDSLDLDAVTQAASLADLAAVFQGGDGSDLITMAVAFSGDTPSHVRLQALAGAGDDFVAVDLVSLNPPGAFNNSVVIHGGSGSDDLSFDGVGQTPCDALIDGGLGFDTFWPGDLSARVRNCETVI